MQPHGINHSNTNYGLPTSTLAKTFIATDRRLFQAMSQDQSKLSHSIDQYQQAAEDLDAELYKAFQKLSRKTGTKLWKPSQSLQREDDVPKLDDAVKEIYEKLEELREFDHEQKSKYLWNKVKRGINKFVKCTIPALKNFMIATKDLQSVSECE